MKTIGLIGGMSWESTQTYYRLINQGVNKRLGGRHSAKILLYSVDFAEVEAQQMSGDWDASGDLLATAAQRLELAGADLILICTNTMHKVFDRVQAEVSRPLIHLADATAEQLVRDGIRSVGLLGTRFTMEQTFYRECLEKAGLKVLVPEQNGRDEIHRIIYEELCCGRIEDVARQRMVRDVELLAQRGAEAVILGCTEIGLLLKPGDGPLPLYDTTEIHARAAVAAALA